MADQEKYLHTTHRTASWFKKAHEREELELSPPFQRNPVWTPLQQSYLIDTILHGLPVPELYMQDVVSEAGDEKHIVVDGQQRVRAVLGFVHGEYAMDGDAVATRWRGLTFDQLSPLEKQTVFSYKFVVRVLPGMPEEDLRKIFARLNRNVVALNEQELRNATYWGPFIKTIQKLADDDPFWAESGVFTANDHRRMLDHEFISELAIAFLHGPQNKKDKLDYYYQLHEVEFEQAAALTEAFTATTKEIVKLLPQLSTTRWRKKSDFYTLFLVLASRAADLPMSRDQRAEVGKRLLDFAARVDALTRLEEEEWVDVDPAAAKYTRAVARAASDRGNRVARHDALEAFAFTPEVAPSGRTPRQRRRA